MTDADSINSQTAWLENKDGKGQKWIKHLIGSELKQDFHSLAVFDFDNDGDADVFSGGGPLTSDTIHRWYIWENKYGKGKQWKQHEIFKGKRCHEAMAGDVDGDGDIDICSKPWNGNEHVYLRNMLIETGMKK